MTVDRRLIAGRACHCDPGLPRHFVHSEALREACDIVFDYDANVRPRSRPEMTVRSLAPIGGQMRPGDTVHVKADLLHEFVRYVLPNVRAPFVLVTGDSDVGEVRRFEHLLDDERVRHWFAQNCDVAYAHPRLTRIPIGLDNPVYLKRSKRVGFAAAMLLGRIPFDPTCSRNSIGDQALLQRIAAELRTSIREKPARALCTFHRQGLIVQARDTVPERREAADVLGSRPCCEFIGQRLRQAEYWRAHEQYAFEVSPRGKGLDCFRTWECLLLQCIPIVKSSPLDALYRQEDLPVAIVQSFDEITDAALGRWKTELQDRFTPDLLDRLTSDYWVRRIRLAAVRAAA
jgi:hypothetical protein